MPVVSSTHLFHYAVVPYADFDAIVRDGLRPLSDFRVLPGTLLHDRARLRIPVERIEPGSAVLTWDRDDGRVRLPSGAEALVRAQAEWDAEEIESWFGRDRTRLFFHVPQVAAYQSRIEVGAGDVEAPV